ncbi:1-phosphofructokinase family hexose kinase [Mahella australiensis]|uniref:Tagatose-6-phosphate kinase n=1 Tax=Mahella australiensis (strain DSM 15567 / CIP 107919 / 50-1 BON) TaxID=697281 RepID=F3ZZ70_MAHA5|nr:1-phosphofructokinase family hexose kinase [Mahella australiensis]AEE97852.1 1-phosphofructokinase [Mahella australiensis 50-1 BON]
MITTVTLNPAIDQTIIVDEFKPGEIHKVKVRRMDVGGKGINVSKLIRVFDGDTTAIGYLGTKNKQFFEDFFRMYGIKYDFVLVEGDTRTNTKIIDLSRHQTTEFNESGFSITQEDVEKLKVIIKKYEMASKYIVFSGSMYNGNYPGLFGEYLAQIGDHNKIVIDATGEMLLEGVKYQPFLVKPNIDELKATFGINSSSLEDIIRAAISIRERFHIKWILLSMGANGAALISREMILKADALKVNVKSTVGAGDSMMGGFIYSYDLYGDPIEAFRYAMACGAAAVTTEGTEVFPKEFAMDLYKEVVITDMTSVYLSYKG